MVAKPIEIVSQSIVNAVTFVDESQVIWGDRSGFMRRWRIEDGQQLGPTMQAGNIIYSIVVSKDGRWIVSGDHGRKVIIWNATTHEKELVFTEHRNPVITVDISNDSNKVASVDWDTICIFNPTSGIRLLPPLKHDEVRDVKFSPDGNRFATASHENGFRVYRTHNGDILFDSGVSGSTRNSLWESIPLVWSLDGLQLFIATIDKIICFNVSNSSYSDWSIHETKSPVSIASNNRFIACSAGSSVSLWDCVSHKQISGVVTNTAEIRYIALSPSGIYLACGLKSEKMTIHNLRDVLPPKYFYHDLPLIQVSYEALTSWTRDDLANTEILLSEEVMSASIPSHYVLANRALTRVRLEQVALAMDDVTKSLQVQPSPIGYIAMAVVLLSQGDREGALCTFDLAFLDCDPHDIRFLFLLKSILVFESGNQEQAITHVEHLARRAKDDHDDDATYLYNQILGAMHMKKKNYGCAIPLLERAMHLAPKEKQCPTLKTILLIFGWSCNELDIVARQRLCETLYAEGRVSEVVEILLNLIRTSNKEIQGKKEFVDWIKDYTKKCVTYLEHVGDKTFRSLKHVDAISQLSSLLFIVRSSTRAARGLWEDALQDANEVVKADPSYPWGYEAKYIALHAAKRYDEAIDAFESMLRVIEQSHDPAIRQLRENYISPSETITAIDQVVCGTLESCPLVVIDVTTGYLCDGPERMRVFKDDPSFKDLVSSMTTELDNERIRQVVARFFGYVMFSHAWQGNEPLFQDVNLVKSVWKLAGTALNEKLRNFCKEAHRLGHNWAWSDTCCIDKTTSSILNQSLTSMYRWYADSAATLVFLADVAHPSKTGDLTRSRWMTRAWTLQELLAPKVIFFYDSEWKPYLGNTGPNHKETPQIMQELADAIKTSHETIGRFSPDGLGVREKLRLASTRNATVMEDVAYSLIGIFKSDIRPQYGEKADALGHLLEEIVSHSGEVTVLAWSGKSSSYNSCLPALVSVYNQIPYNPPSLEGEEMETCIAELRGKLAQQDALSIYNRISFLPAARFATRRLHLPCIVFSVRRLVMYDLRRGSEKLYRAKVSGLGKVEFTTADDLPLDKPQKLVFVHPWIRYIRGPSDGVAWGDDFESDTDSDSDLDSSGEARWDEVATAPPLRAGSTLQINDYTRALQTIARLRQPFNALLLIQLPHGEYKRVAAENEIIVSGLGTDITFKSIRTKVLEIL